MGFGRMKIALEKPDVATVWRHLSVIPQAKPQACECPKSVKIGSTTVKVYQQTRANGTPGHYVTYYSSCVRRMRSFLTADAALLEAN